MSGERHFRQPLLAAQQLTIGYRSGRHEKAVAQLLDLELRAGELVALIGPNGAGKSTLMRTLAGLQLPLHGQIHLGETPLPQLSPAALAKQLAVVLTERVEIGNLSAYALIALGRHPYTDWRGTLSPHDEEIVRWALTAVNAIPLAQRPVTELSDGERQKIMIARALAQEAPILLLDEPTAFLDLPRRVEILRLLGTLTKSAPRAILVSTHDLDLALRVADRLWLLSADGHLAAGLPEELALSGALHRVFASEGVSFDLAAGTFQLQRTPCGPIGLRGEGIVAQWTTRALERVGYQVISDADAAPQSVTVNETGWLLHSKDDAHLYASLAELIERVQRSTAA